jgi:auxin-responsive protein IAA
VQVQVQQPARASLQETESIRVPKLAALPAKQEDSCGMELELGLAPPSARRPTHMTIDQQQRHLAEDELSSTSSDHHPCAARSGKRGFAEAFQETAAAATTTTLPLFDDGSSCGGRSGGGKRPLVGWPPLSSARSRACGGGAAKYVKVKKEGDAIGRKVDLSLHASYDELLATLARMFPTNNGSQGRYPTIIVKGICNHPIQPTDSGNLISELLPCCPVADDKEISSKSTAAATTTTSHRDVVVTYEDGEGDWMLLGDVPWE